MLDAVLYGTASAKLVYIISENDEKIAEIEKELQYVLEWVNPSIAYEVNTNLVRGLDYYTHTVFEVEASVEGFGSQNVLCGGGRYDNLVETLDGPKTSGVGFAMGIERLMTALEYENVSMPLVDGIDCYVIPMSENEKDVAEIPEEIKQDTKFIYVKNYSELYKKIFKVGGVLGL